MPVPAWSPDDFAHALAALLPRGRAWPTGTDSMVARICGVLAPSFQRSASRGAALLADAFPQRPLELLPEWEATLGLPDPCAGANPTIAQRQAAVLARFTADGGQTPAYFVAIAAALGFVITITQFAPFRVGHSRVGDPLCDASWSSAWQVNAPADEITWFRVGQGAAGEPLAVWNDAVLQCTLTEIKPAHTLLIFAYS